MNALTTTRWTVLAVGFVVVVSGVGGALGTVGAPGMEATAMTPQTIATNEVVEAQNESDENESGIPPNQTIEAMQTVENETNGTVIGAQLSGQGNGGLERSTFVYEFDVLADNGTRLVAEVYAENATVIGVKSANESDGFLEDLFASEEGATDEEATDEARNASSLLSATTAVERAVNETGAESMNQTVTEVKLGSQNDTLVYTVTMFESGGEPREVVVGAQKGADDIVTTDA